MPIRINGSTSGYVELAAPAVAGTTVLTLPTDSIQPGLVLLNTTTFSAASSVSLNNVFTSTYENYRMVVNVTGATSTNATVLVMRLRAGGVDASASDYFYHEVYSTNTGGPSRTYSAAGNQPLIGYAADQQGGSTTDIFRPAIAAQTFWTGMGQGWGSSNNAYNLYANRHTLTNAYDGCTIFAASGTITGTVRVYGYRNS